MKHHLSKWLQFSYGVLLMGCLTIIADSDDTREKKSCGQSNIHRILGPINESLTEISERQDFLQSKFHKGTSAIVTKLDEIAEAVGSGFLQQEPNYNRLRSN